MKSLPRVTSFFKRLIQITSMEHSSFLAIVRRILIYLKEIFLREFSKFTPLSQEVIADFATLFIVCAVVIIILLISSKLSKYYEKNVTRPEVLQPENSQQIDLTEKEEENNHESTYDLQRFNYECGDGPFIPQKNISRKKKVIRQKPKSFCIPTDDNTSRHSGFNLKFTHSQYLPNSQKKNKTLTSLIGNQTWLIRRTRSGQIYGKYPI